MFLEVEKQMHPYLRPFVQVMRGLAAILGDDCEILLYDVGVLERSVVACVNGHITGRELGSPMTGYGLELINSANRYRDGVHIYMARANNGVLIKCGVIFLRDEKDRLVGLLCLHFDTTRAQTAQSLIGQFFSVGTDAREPESEPVNEFFGIEIEDVFKNTLQEIRGGSGKPLRALSKGEKVEVVRGLMDRGFFMMKGAVEFLAREMGNSKFTLYAYMRECKKSG